MSSAPLTQFVKIARRDDTGGQGDNSHAEKGWEHTYQTSGACDRNHIALAHSSQSDSRPIEGAFFFMNNLAEHLYFVGIAKKFK